MTDIEKYKSVAIKIDAYKKAKPMAEKKIYVHGIFYTLLNRQRRRKTNIEKWRR